MGKATVLDVIRKSFQLRIRWLGSDHFECMFAVDHHESPKLAVEAVFATMSPPRRMLMPLIGCMLISIPLSSKMLLEIILESIPGT
jgi:hypothetical protein